MENEVIKFFQEEITSKSSTAILPRLREVARKVELINLFRASKEEQKASAFAIIMRIFHRRADSDDIESAALEQLLSGEQTNENKNKTMSEMLNDSGYSTDKPFSAATRLQKGILIGVSIALTFIAAVELGILAPTIWNNNTSWAFQPYPKFLVIGDWGRNGDYNQSLVADAMARKAAHMKSIDFIVSTGDNFYESGLVSVDDIAFNTSFIDIYHHKELQVPWHVVLGNHDYGEADDPSKRPDSCPKNPKNQHPNATTTTTNTYNTKDDECFYSPLHQLDIRLAQRDSRWHCERTFTLQLMHGDIELFFIDTNPMMSQYKDEKWVGNRGGLLEQSWEGQVRELEGRLSRSTAQWKIVVGHHPTRSNHRPDLEFEDMVEKIEPLLTKYKVNAYMCGHDHNLQYIYNKKRGYHQITSGAGSQIGSGFYGDKESPFQYAGNGFVAVSFMGRKKMRVEFMGVDGDVPLFVVDIDV